MKIACPEISGQAIFILINSTYRQRAETEATTKPKQMNGRCFLF